MKNRSKAYYRDMRKKAIERKKRIINAYRHDNFPAYFNEYDDDYDSSYGNIFSCWYVAHKGMLAKGKIHCSCSLCSFHGTPMQDKRALKRMESSLLDIEEENYHVNNSGIPTLKNQLRKSVNGVYYPKRGLPGTTISADKHQNISEFKNVVDERSITDML